jgi:curved DNA-binding protein
LAAAVADSRRGPAARSGDTRAKLAIPLEIAYSGGMQKIGVDGRTLEVKIPAASARDR